MALLLGILIVLFIGITVGAFFLFSPDPKPEYYNISGCENEPVTLECGNKVIQSAVMKYGRWDHTVCGHPTVNTSTNLVSKDYQLISAIGTNNYTMGSKNSNENVKEDIYPNIYKHWDINYSCL